MRINHFFGVIAAAAVLAGCSSAGEKLSDALTKPLDPKVKGHYNGLEINGRDNTLLEDNDSSITITDGTKKQTIRRGAVGDSNKFDISYKLKDKITNLDYEVAKADGTKRSGDLLIYKQGYSVIVGKQQTHTTAEDGVKTPSPKNFEVNSIQGTHTTEDKLPSGKIRYEGLAFAGGDDRNGKLDYTIDFGRKTGEGSITGLKGVNKVMLENHRLHARPDGTVGVDGGRAVSSGLTGGSYGLTLYGPQADELAGSAYFSNGGNSKQIGFGGSQKK